VVLVDSQQGTTEQAPKRDEKGRLLPGHTANPGGRVSTWLKAVKAELRAGSRDAADYLRRVVSDEDASCKDRIAAAKTILDFTVTKPKQTLEVKRTADDLLSGLDREALVDWASREG
jgi:hypothetical protein